MKISNVLLISTILAFSATAVNAAPLKGCAAKKHDVETQLSYARAHGNKAQIRGLEKALKETTEHCNDTKLRAERERKVQEKQAKVSKIEQELQQQKQLGNPSKIEKRQKKLQRAQEELREAKADLNS